MFMKHNSRFRLMLMVSMAIFGTLAPFVRNIPVSSAELSLFRAVLAASLIGIFLLVTGQKIPVRSLKKELLLLMGSGASMAVNWILLFEAYNLTSYEATTRYQVAESPSEVGATSIPRGLP